MLWISTMIPRKRLHLLLCILQIFYVFGDGDPGTDDELNFVTNFPDSLSVYETTSIADILGWPIERNTIPSEQEEKKNKLDSCMEKVADDSTEDGNREIYVQNLTVVDYSAHSLTIQWDKFEGVGEVNYLIEWFSEDSDDPLNIPKAVKCFTYNISNLDACTTYRISVTPIVDKTHLMPKCIIGKTNFSTPGKVDELTTESGHHYIYVKWKPPQDNVRCLTHYSLEICEEDGVCINPKDVPSNTTSYNMTNLHPCMDYNVTVTAAGGEETSQPYTANPQTLSLESAPPQWINDSIVVTPDSITLQWRIVNENNNCKMISIITECAYVNSEGIGYDVALRGSSNITIANGPDITTNTTVTNLTPYTTFKCHAVVFNVAGNSSSSYEIKNITTAEDVPDEPLNFKVSSSTGSEICWQWRSPGKIPGELLNYEILLTWTPHYPIPDWCSVLSTNTIKDIEPNKMSYTFRNWSSFSNFTAQIKARTGAGWGNYSSPIKFETAPGVPDKVTNLTVETKSSDNDSNALSTVLRWGLPCALNGELSQFEVSYTGKREGYDDHSFSTKVPGITEKNQIFEYDFGELKARYTYIFRVATAITDVVSQATELTVEYPDGIPPQPDEEYVKSITLNPDKARRTTTSAAILLPLFPTDNGNIQYYAIMVSEKGYNNGTFSRYDGLWPNATSWEESMENDFTIAYQATAPWWNPFPKHVIDYGHMKAVKYVVGEETTCKEVSMNMNTRVYCNGPLKPDKSYEVRMRAFTAGGYTDSMPFYIKTNAELNVALVIGVVFGILFLGILTTMMLLVRRCSVRILFQRLLHADIPGSPVPAPFTRRKFISHCQQLADNPGKLSNEFQLLQTLSVDLQMPTNAACLQANRKKNRYSDILPYDFTRVKLDVIDNDPNSDYINASFIRGYSCEEEYIACQGPKEDTTYDFWRMIDQYDVKMILMLTQLVEKGKDKCHQYFPTIRETFTYEKMSIRCTSELDYRTFTQRTLVMEKNEKKRNIIHLHFKDWPDHDVPDEFDAMINFCQIMRRQITALKGLVVIHCSAGIGRTGTLIAIDVLLQAIRDNRKLDVFGTVYRLRRHRLNMVQRESQYAYIYNCIRQVLKNPYFLKTYKPPPIDPLDANAKNKKDRTYSTADSVSSIDTLRKSSITGSADSMEPLYQSSPQSTPKLQTALGLTAKGLRFCKSTSAIDTRSNHNRMGRSGSEGYTVCESAVDSSSISLESIDETTDHKTSKNSLGENTKLLRSMSSNVLEMREYEYLTNDSADKDTSL